MGVDATETVGPVADVLDACTHIVEDGETVGGVAPLHADVHVLPCSLPRCPSPTCLVAREGVGIG